MAQFLKFNFLIALQKFLMGVNLINKYQIMVISKSGEKSNLNCKVISWKIEFENLGSNTRVNKNKNRSRKLT